MRTQSLTQNLARDQQLEMNITAKAPISHWSPIKSLGHQKEGKAPASEISICLPAVTVAVEARWPHILTPGRRTLLLTHSPPTTLWAQSFFYWIIIVYNVELSFCCTTK